MHGDQDDRGSHTPEEAWERIVARFARFSGVVGEVEDPLTWGLDLDEETVTGADTDGEDDGDDAVEERFLRSYVSFQAEAFDVETLRVRAAGTAHACDLVRTALSGLLAAPLHSGAGSTDDFLDSYQEYREAMRDIVAEVKGAEAMPGSFVVDGVPRRCLEVTARGVVSVYAPVADRALVVSGPADLVGRVDVVMRPIRNLLHGEEGPRF